MPRDRRVPQRRHIRFRAWLVCSAALTSLALSPGVARAEAGRALVFPFEGFELPTDFAKEPERLAAVVELQFRAADYEMAASTMMLRDMMVALECERLDGECARAMAEHFEVEVLVVGKIVYDHGTVVAQLRRYAADGTLTSELTHELPVGSVERSSVYRRIGSAVVAALTEVPPEPGDGAGTAPAAALKSGKLRAPTIAIGAAGLALAIGGIVTAALTSAANSEFNRLQEEGFRTAADFEAAEPVERRGRALEVVTPVLFAVGGAAVATAVVLAVLDLRSGPPGKPAASAGFVPLPRGGMVTLELRLP